VIDVAEREKELDSAERRRQEHLRAKERIRQDKEETKRIRLALYLLSFEFELRERLERVLSGRLGEAPVHELTDYLQRSAAVMEKVRHQLTAIRPSIAQQIEAATEEVGWFGGVMPYPEFGE
jgi:hypothetical protein